MFDLRRLLCLAVVAMAVGSEAKEPNAQIEANWCLSDKLVDGEICPVEFVPANPQTKTIGVFLLKRSKIIPLVSLKSPFKVQLKFAGSGDMTLMLVGYDEQKRPVGESTETIEIDQKVVVGPFLGDQDRRTLFDVLDAGDEEPYYSPGPLMGPVYYPFSYFPENSEFTEPIESFD
jgi:hypothetical protein